MSANNGGPAFPIVIKLDEESKYCEGMTLRDYFAAKAMQGLLACGDAHDEDTKTVTSRVAYAMADAMLAEREKGGAK